VRAERADAVRRSAPEVTFQIARGPERLPVAGNFTSVSWGDSDMGDAVETCVRNRARGVERCVNKIAAVGNARPGR
jgi:hypothetical protein